MVDPGTGLTVLGTAIGSQDLVKKILGPSADYLGASLADLTQRAVKNTGRIFEKAAKKLGNQINQPGAVPPKVLKGVLEGAPFCDDTLGAEYFAGVLASSRTEVGRDDRGASFLSLVGRLSTYQIRSHYLFYEMVRALYGGIGENLGAQQGREKLRTFVPMRSYIVALEFGKGEDINTILSHVMFGLSREALIEGAFQFGPNLIPSAVEHGILFAPSALGIELFMWAHGMGILQLNGIITPNALPRIDVTIEVLPLVRSVNFPERCFPELPK